MFVLLSTIITWNVHNASLGYKKIMIGAGGMVQWLSAHFSYTRPKCGSQQLNLVAHNHL